MDGDSRGHWEGNTSVVDTTNYTDKIVSNAFNCCRGADANLHVIERFTRVSDDSIDYQSEGLRPHSRRRA